MEFKKQRMQSVFIILGCVSLMAFIPVQEIPEYEFLWSYAYADEDLGAVEPTEPSQEPFEEDNVNEYDAEGGTIVEGTGTSRSSTSGSLVSQHEIKGTMHNVLKVFGMITILNTDAAGSSESATNLCWIRIHFGPETFWDLLFWVTFKTLDHKDNIKECTGKTPDKSKQVIIKIQPSGDVEWKIEKIWGKK